MKLFVPGRICLVSEHSDRAGGYRRINAQIEKGYTLITGTDQGIFAEVAPHPTSLVLTSTDQDGKRQGPTDLPIKKGLSSSAAVCVLTARAFNRVFDLKMTTRGEMELAYQGEITTPSRCGRMDQGCAFGSRPVLMTFDGDRL